jgi:Spy/CpxP family protein refolding chaperone
MSKPRTVQPAARAAVSARPAFAALLATAAVVVAASLALPARAMPGGAHGAHEGPRGGAAADMALPFANPRMAARLLDSIDATPEQRTQIRALTEAAQRDLQPVREAGRQLRERATALFTQPTVDAREAEALRQQMLARHDATSQRMTQLMLDVSRVLTPEQRQRVAQRLAQRRDMMQRHHRERRQLDAPPR